MNALKVVQWNSHQDFMQNLQYFYVYIGFKNEQWASFVTVHNWLPYGENPVA